MAEQTLRNQRAHDELARNHPEHVGRAFGAAAEARTGVELAQKVCESVSRTILGVFLEKFDELANRMAAEQKALQAEMLRNLGAAMKELRAPPGRLGDGAADQEVIDVDECAPTASDGRGRSQIKVSDFMRANWKDEWASVNVKSYLLKFSLLLKSKATRTASGPKY